MKVLITVDRKEPETYMHHLVDGLERRGVAVRCSTSVFDRPDPSFDLMHVHWPEALCGWERPTEGRVAEIADTLGQWKEAGVVRVMTRHNAVPHVHDNPAAVQLYEIVQASADGIIHLGRASRQELIDRYDCPQVVIPHGNYPGADPADRSEGRKELEIDPDAFVILVFGAIRHFEEKRLILETLERLPSPKAVFVAPRWDEATQPSWTREPVKRLEAVLTDFKARRAIRVGDGFVERDRVRYYFGAADLVFIPRIDVLNSGVLPLAYSYGKAVVGPATGTLEEILQRTGNITYRPGDPAGAAEALENARDRDLQAIGSANRSYAMTNWNWDDVLERHLNFYEKVLASRKRDRRS